jgi:DNA-binding FadR family transcriptional regulator
VTLVNPTRDAGAVFSGDGGRVGQRVRVPKTAELVAAHLRRQIVRNELHEGDALPPEAVLMAQFGVSRPTLREAFRVLEAEGLISVRRGAHGGARVHTPDVDVAARYAGLVLEHRGATLADVYEAAGMLEPTCASALAEKHSDTDLARLRDCLAIGEAALKNNADDVEIQAAHDAFHALIVELSGNQTLIVLSRMIRSIVETANTTMAVQASSSGTGRRAARKGQRAHEHLVAAIEAGDAAEAASCWHLHLAAADEYVTSGLGNRNVLDLLS